MPADNPHPHHHPLPNPTVDDSAQPQPHILKPPSVYLTPTHSATADPSPPPASDQPHPQTPKDRKKARAQRLAAEQAQWVRDKFSLPPSELLVASFSAALVRSIRIQGRLHITTSYLCFYAKIFGKVTKELIPFAHVLSVKKRRAGLKDIKIYLNDSTNNDNNNNTQDVAPIVIGSLNHREKALNIISTRLRELNPVAAEWHDPDDTASAASAPQDSEEPSLEDEDDSIPQSTTTRDNSLPQPHSSSANHPHRPASDLTSDLSSHRSSDDNDPFSRTNHSAISNPAFIWRDSTDALDKLAGNAFERRTERARVVLDAPVIDAFNVLFVSQWLKTYHDSTNNRDVEFSDWYRATDSFMTRDVTFRRPLGYKIGPKETRVNEVQRYSFTSDGGVILELEGRNLDAPYGDYFVVESFFEMRPLDDGIRTLLILSVAVHFNKSTLLKGKIESGAMQETKKAFQKVAEMAARRIDEYMASKPPPRHAMHRRPLNSSKREHPSVSTDPTTRIAPAPAGVVHPVSSAPPAHVGAAGAQPVLPRGVETVVTGPPAFAAKDNRAAGAAVLEIQDAIATRWLRVLGIAALLMVCLLLLMVTVQLHRMQSKVSDLEQLLMLSRQQAVGVGKCTAEMCAGTSG